MSQVDLDRRPLVDADRRGSAGAPDLEQALGRDHVATEGLASRGALELAELLQRVDPHVRVGADAERDPAVEEALEGGKPVPEVRLGRRAEADARAALGQEVE